MVREPIGDTIKTKMHPWQTICFLDWNFELFIYSMIYSEALTLTTKQKNIYFMGTKLGLLQNLKEILFSKPLWWCTVNFVTTKEKTCNKITKGIKKSMRASWLWCCDQFPSQVYGPYQSWKDMSQWGHSYSFANL